MFEGWLVFYKSGKVEFRHTSPKYTTAVIRIERIAYATLHNAIPTFPIN